METWNVLGAARMDGAWVRPPCAAFLRFAWLPVPPAEAFLGRCVTKPSPCAALVPPNGGPSWGGRAASLTRKVVATCKRQYSVPQR